MNVARTTLSSKLLTHDKVSSSLRPAAGRDNAREHPFCFHWRWLATLTQEYFHLDREGVTGHTCETRGKALYTSVNVL